MAIAVEAPLVVEVLRYIHLSSVVPLMAADDAVEAWLCQDDPEGGKP